MINSMTGYGKAVAAVNGFTFEIKLKSLNSRFLEISLKIPSVIQSREYELREIIRNRIKRGKLYVSFSLSENGQRSTGFVFNKEKVNGAITTLKQVKKEFGIKDKLQLSHLLSIRDLFTADMDELTDEGYTSVKVAFESAIDQLQQMKRLEGEMLLKDLSQRIDFIEKNLRTIEDTFKAQLQEYLERYRQRVREMIEDITHYNDRLEMEIAMLTERSDIAEECVRLHSHLKFFRETLRQEDAGRKLNFLCQELNREANTIASKAITSEISHTALAMKEEVERIREQVQNIE